MHNYYKENYLYNVEPERINEVYCGGPYVQSYVWFKLVNGDSPIQCDDSETAKIVYNDVCNRLKNIGNFVKVGLNLINISNVQDIRLANCCVGVVFKKGNADIIYCKDSCQANKVYKHLIQRFNECKAKDEETFKL